MRKVYGSNSHLTVLKQDDWRHLSVRLAAVVAPLLKDYLYYVTEGIHGAVKDADGKIIIEPGRCPNANGDLFLWEELIGDSLIPGQKVYQTWIGKPVLENHNPALVRGKILDTYPVSSRRSVDMLNCISRKEYPELCKRIEDGQITDTSMGVLVDYGICSVCGARSRDTDEWCNHLKLYIGKRLPTTGELVYIINHGLIGLEDTLITVGAGADKDSKIREVLAVEHNRQVFSPKVYSMAQKIMDISRELGIPMKDFVEFLDYVKKKNS